MSLIGKIRHFFDPGFYEPEEQTAPEVTDEDRPFYKAPQADGPLEEAMAGGIDANCLNTPLVILKDSSGPIYSDILRARLEEAGIAFHVFEHRPTTAYHNRIPGDHYTDRFYVDAEDLPEAQQLVKAADEEVEAADIQYVAEDGSLIDVDDPEGYEFTAADFLQDSEEPHEGHFQDGEDIYLIGTDFVLIRHCEDEEEKQNLTRLFKLEGIPYTVTTAFDEPDSEPFDGYRIYATSDFKEKARLLADAAEAGENYRAEDDEEAEEDDGEN